MGQKPGGSKSALGGLILIFALVSIEFSELRIRETLYANLKTATLLKLAAQVSG
jgi:hypothetical protein